MEAILEKMDALRDGHIYDKNAHVAADNLLIEALIFLGESSSYPNAGLIAALIESYNTIVRWYA